MSSGPGAALDGGAGDDVIYGSGGTDYIVCGDGVDVAISDALTDYLFGGDGNDSLLAGGQTDYVFGNAGNDFIYTDDPGTRYADFVYAGPGTGVDTVADFTPGDGLDHDTLVVTGTSLTAQLLLAGAVQVGVYTVMTITPTDQVYLYNVQPFQLTAANFLFL